jgi:hypothetical protein
MPSPCPEFLLAFNLQIQKKNALLALISFYFVLPYFLQSKASQKMIRISFVFKAEPCTTALPLRPSLEPSFV